MRHYFAGFVESGFWHRWDEFCTIIPFEQVIKRIYVLGSYYYLGESSNSKSKNFDYSLPKDFMVDSGAYTFIDAQKKGKKLGTNIDWMDYAKRYGEWLKSHPEINHFFELDIDSVLPDGYKGTIPLRKTIEDICGKPSIPVYHDTRTIDEWHQLCEDYDYVAIGGIAHQGSDADVLNPLVDIAHSHGARIHGLGKTNQKIIEQVPFDSIDSTSYLTNTRYGVFRYFNHTSNYLEKYGANENNNLWPHVKDYIYSVLQDLPFAEYCDSLPSTWDGSDKDIVSNKGK